MVFSSILFLLYFLPIFLVVYQFLSKTESKNLWILLASIFFYSWGAPWFVFILISSTILDFHLVKQMYNCRDLVIKKRWLITSITLNLGLLAYFKYSNFFVENINSFLTMMDFQPMAWIKVALPIGISFYTFQTLTYSIDVYRGVSKPLQKVSDYLLYIMMFPQLIAGPIVRYNLVADQIKARQEKYDDKLNGIFRFSIGLAKKVLIANQIGTVIDPLFSDISSLNTGMAWLVIMAYAFQIYFDFSGYSDMAIGLGKMMGFKFPENFNSPYISKNITEFWRRWHITLGNWMKDYLYIPLGGNRVSSTGRLYFNLGFVFLMSGLWHGASWNFVLWGVFHGSFLVLDRLFLIKLNAKFGGLFSIMFTFTLVVLSWVVFRLEQMDDIFLYYQKLFNFSGWEITTIGGAFWITFCSAILFSFCTLSRNVRVVEQWMMNTPKKPIGMILQFIGTWAILLICIATLSTSDFNPFIYFKF